MDLFSVVESLHLKDLPSSWTLNQWENDFSLKEFPPEFEASHDGYTFSSILSNLNSALQEWSKEAVSNTSVPSASSTDSSFGPMPTYSWITLVNSGIDYKALIAFISSFLRTNAKELDTDETREAALSSAKAYFALLSIPLGNAYTIFVPELFSQAVETLKLVYCFERNPTAPRGDEGEEEVEPETQISDEEMKNIIEKTVAALEELNLCLDTVELNGFSESVDELVSFLCELTRLEKSSETFVLAMTKKLSVTYIAFLAYQTLLSLFRTRHGNVSNTFRQVCKKFLPHFMITGQEKRDSPKPIIRGHMLNFLSLAADTLKDDSSAILQALIQQLCVRAPDKADGRAKMVDHILFLMKLLPNDAFASSVTWIAASCLCEFINSRLIGLDLLAHLSSVDNDGNNWSDRLVDTGPQQPSPLNLEMLILIIMSRILDTSPSVKIKALTIFSNFWSTKASHLIHLIQSIFVEPYKNVPLVDSARTNISLGKELQEWFSSGFTGERPHFPSGAQIVYIVESVTKKRQAMTRKAAFAVLFNICRLGSNWLTSKRLGMFQSACMDPSIAVRRPAIVSLTDLLLLFPEKPLLIEAWTKSVFPLVRETDAKLQEKVLEVIGNVMLESLADGGSQLLWKILYNLSHLSLSDLFKSACHHWHKNKLIGKPEITALRDQIGTENNLLAWYFLASLSSAVDIHKPVFIVQYFYDNFFGDKNDDEYLGRLVGDSLVNSCQQLGDGEKASLYTKLVAALESFSFRVPMISRIMDTAQLLKRGTFVSCDCPNIIDACKLAIETHKARFEQFEEMELFCRVVFTLGEAVAVCPRTYDKPTLDFLIETIGKPHSEPGSWPTRAVAVSVTTLSRMGLSDEILAKQIVPVLSVLLKNSSTPVEVKTNIMIAFSDLCTRYTALIDSRLEEMFLTLKDKSLSVRKVSLSLMCSLIKEDFIKMKCPSFFYFLTTLIDSDPAIRELSSNFIETNLIVKHPKIMGANFIDALFFFNDYKNTTKFSLIEQSSRKAKAAFSLPGKGNVEKRRTILKYMVDSMNDDSKFRIIFIICDDILDPVAEGTIPLSDVRGQEVLSDALHILQSDELRLKIFKSRSEDDDMDEDPKETPAAPIEKTNRVLRVVFMNALLKRSYLENAVPIILKLKRKLIEAKSPFYGDLMGAIKELMRNFKNELKEIFEADPVFAAELEYDIRAEEHNEIVESAPDSPTSSFQPPDEMVECIQAAVNQAELLTSFRENMSENDSTEVATQDFSQEFPPMPSGTNKRPCASLIEPAIPEIKRDPSTSHRSPLSSRPVSPNIVLPPIKDEPMEEVSHAEHGRHTRTAARRSSRANKK